MDTSPLPKYVWVNKISGKKYIEMYSSCFLSIYFICGPACEISKSSLPILDYAKWLCHSRQSKVKSQQNKNWNKKTNLYVLMLLHYTAVTFWVNWFKKISKSVLQKSKHLFAFNNITKHCLCLYFSLNKYSFQAFYTIKKSYKCIMNGVMMESEGRRGLKDTFTIRE